MSTTTPEYVGLEVYQDNDPTDGIPGTWVRLGQGYLPETTPAPTPAPSPAPSPSPSPGSPPAGEVYPPVYGTLGEYKPSPSTTGDLVRRMEAGGLLKIRTTDLYADTGGTVYDGWIFLGKVVVRSAYVKFRRCWFAGPKAPTGGDFGLLTATHANVDNLLVEDCLFKPQTPDTRVNGILGHDFTVRRSEFVNCVDAWGIYNTGSPNAAVNVLAEGNYVDLLFFIRPEGGTLNRAEGTHNDGAQVQSGSKIKIFGNNIRGLYDPALGSASIDPKVDDVRGSPYFPSMGATSALIVTPNVGPVADVVIQKNWLDGGGPGTVILNQRGRGAVARFALLDNRFGRTSNWGGHQALIQADTYDAAMAAGLIARNVMEDGVGTPKITRTAAT